ncbi:MAG: penicillin-binding protein, partial [Alphaproteobacteria bacterium]|nr:penicillin-binding protein [Alphaproteobacteria bacterium]
GTGGLLLMLALAIPAFRETADDDWLKKSELAVTFLDRYGTEIGSRGIRHNDSIPLAEFPDHLIKAVLATEDRRFYDHFGIDVPGTLRAVLTNARAGGVVQGGSSITQQLAKNLFLSNERTIERKVKEAFLAMWLEARLPKNEIFKLYLDRAYLGGGTFGVDAAAQYYFNKSARDVNLSEAAMLAGLFKAPSKFAPHVNLPAARARANVVLDNLVEAGFMTEGQVFGARRNPATAVDRRDERAPNYYLDWAFDEMKKLVDMLPKSVHERVFVARLAVDLNLQRQAEKVIETALRQYGRDYHAKQSASVLMETDGAVRAMVGGRDYGESQFNRATDALRQPGSSFKPYVYATALASGGFKPNSIVVDSQVCIGNWCPKNYSGGFSGPMTLTQAIVHSINVIPVKLSIALGNGNPKLGRAKIIETARGAGLRTPLPDTPSMPIGADEVTILDHTGGYGIFVNAGMSIAPHAILEVRNGSGELIWRFDRDGKKPTRVISPQVAADMSMMMSKVVEEGTAKRAILEGIKAAGKTGTTNSYRDAWFVGFTGNYIAGVWFGNDDYTSTNRMTGGSLPAEVWHDIMTYAHQGVELKPIPGLGLQPPPAAAKVAAANAAAKPDLNAQQRPAVLTKRGAEILVHLERLMDDATRALAERTAPERNAADAGGTPGQAGRGTIASASERADQGMVRGN